MKIVSDSGTFVMLRAFSFPTSRDACRTCDRHPYRLLKNDLLIEEAQFAKINLKQLIQTLLAVFHFINRRIG
jgi:hypothetical protein